MCQEQMELLEDKSHRENLCETVCLAIEGSSVSKASKRQVKTCVGRRREKVAKGRSQSGRNQKEFLSGACVFRAHFKPVRICYSGNGIVLRGGFKSHP